MCCDVGWLVLAAISGASGMVSARRVCCGGRRSGGCSFWEEGRLIVPDEEKDDEQEAREVEERGLVRGAERLARLVCWQLLGG